MSGKLIHLMVVVLVAGIVQTSLGSVAEPNLVGWWRFDEGSGTVAADSSGRGRDGTLLLGPVWREDGVRGGCMYFDGTDDFIQVAHHDSLNPGTGSFTILLWSNVDPTPGTVGDTTWDLAVAKRDSGTNTIGYYVGAQRTQGGGPGKTGYKFMLGNMERARVDTPFTPVPLGEWVFVAAVLDRSQNIHRISVDGGLTWATATPPTGLIAPTMDLSLGGDVGQNNYWFHGQLDDVAVFNRALSDSQINLIMQRGMTPELAYNVQPEDRDDDVPSDSVLIWEPGLYAVTHDVYFGDDAADVAAASRTNLLDVLVRQGQTTSEYDPGQLVLGETYYWRIDEVNAAPYSTIFQGEVWSFTVEPVGYELPVERIIATASSSSSADEGPGKTIGSVGLDADGLHSMDTAEMWLSGEVAEGQSAWIQYEFDRVYSLHQMLVWNHNGQTESLMGVGIKEAIVEYSLDGTEWARLGDVQTFTQAPGKAGYASDTMVDFAEAAARYVKITAASNWKGIFQQYGLSEVRFLYVPMRARRPEPASDVNEVYPELTLTWRPGRRAAQHNVYLSTDEQAAIDRTAPVVTVSEASHDPGMLDLGQTYYWTVDEVNDAAGIKVWEGDVWNFSTQEFRCVDDFESYTDYSPDKIFQTWIDGWGFSPDNIFPDGQDGNGTGSQVGYLDPPFAEPTIVHSGRQSMYMTYSNIAPKICSEAERTFPEPPDWTLYGAGALTVYFRGTPDNTGQLYVKINGTKVPYDGDAAIDTMVWQPWNIDLSKVNADLKSVRTLTIGVDGAGATGTLYIDDIRLYPKPPEAETGTEPDRAHLVAYYSLNGSTDDGSGNGYHGVANGGPTYVSGVRGQAMQFDGADDYVGIATQDRLNPGAGSFSVTCWAYLDPTPGTTGLTNWDLAVAKRETGSKGWYVGADRNQGTATQAGWKFMLGPSTSALRKDTPYVLVPLDEWVFVVAVLDRDQNVHKISVDGGLTWKTATPPALPITSTKDLTLGYDIGPNNYWFHGNVDEVRIYDKALTADEVTWLALH